jgi:photosystem II stability/assembly factor-like uncharacterized protein
MNGKCNAGVIGEVYGAYFVAQHGWLKAFSGTWQTSDGGLTWRRIFKDRYDGLYFADSQHGWMNLRSDSAQQSYLTDDGGETWKPCGSLRQDNGQQPGRNVYFLSPKLGWAITSHVYKDRRRIEGFARTIDGGCHWEQVWTSFEHPDARYSDVYFLNENEGWLAGEMVLYHTTDRGKNWYQVLRPTEGTNVHHVYFASAEEGWIIGGHKNMSAGDTGLYYTGDGGYTWRQLTGNEVVKGFEENNRLTGIPENWKAGRLFQMLYRRRDRGEVRTQ